MSRVVVAVVANVIKCRVVVVLAYTIKVAAHFGAPECGVAALINCGLAICVLISQEVEGVGAQLAHTFVGSRDLKLSRWTIALVGAVQDEITRAIALVCDDWISS